MVSPEPHHDSVAQLLDRAHACREELRKGAQECLEEHLIEIAGIENPSDARLETTYRTVLQKIGVALFKATKPFLVDNESELNFYFWPGYQSLLIGTTGNRRLTLIEHSTGKPLPCGIGYYPDAHKEPKAYLECNSSIWFERALTKCTGHDTHQTFVPGSTHAWISQRRLRVRPPHSIANGFLTALEISLSDHNAATVGRGVLSIELDQTRFDTWARTIADCLNGDYLEHSQKWPVPLEPNSNANSSLATRVRLDLYNIWLAACFGTDWSPNWRDSLFDTLNKQNLGCLVERLDVPKDEYLDHLPPCRHWYTLRLEKTLETNGEFEPLGSAMFLTSARLDPAYVYLASAFVNEMYFRMRDLESTIQARDRGQKEKEIQVLQKYKSLAQDLSQSLRSAVNVYHRAAREMMPSPNDLLDLYRPSKAYIPETPTPYFNGRFQFRHDWSADELNNESTQARRLKLPETFRVQVACILLSYLGEANVPHPGEEWMGSTNDLVELLRKRTAELRVFEHLIGSTIAGILDENKAVWTEHDQNAFQRVLKGCFHYPFKLSRLTGPLLGLWVLERRTDMNLDERVMSWLFGPRTINGHGWPGIEALQAIYALYQEVVRKQPCGLSIKVLENENRLRGVEVEFSSCSHEVFSSIKLFLESPRPDGGGLAEAMNLIEESHLDLQTFPKGNVVVIAFPIGS